MTYMNFARAALFTILSMVLIAAGSGCVRPYGVPPFSQLVAQAPGGQVASFAAPDEGTVYVAGPGRPGQERHIMYTGVVHRGETLTLDPPHDQLLVDGKIVPASVADAREGYTVWFHAVPHDLIAP